ncbi:MAG: AraC family ligand binding domain-containing protein, partial [Phycisphaerae bacterium]
MNEKEFAVDEIIARYTACQGAALTRLMHEMQTLGPRISFTARGRKLGLFTNLRRITAATAFPEHRHDFFELSFILEGAGRHRIDNLTYPVAQGDIFFLNHERPHRYVLAPGERLTILNFAFMPEYLEQALTFEKLQGQVQFFLLEPFFRSINDLDVRLRLTGNPFFRAMTLGLFILDEFNHCYPAASELAPLCFKAFIMLIVGEYEKRLATRPGLSARREAVFREVLSFINGRVSEEMSLETISAAVGLGRTRLT